MKKFTLVFVILMISFSCREEIIAPDNLVGNINEPVQLRERNAYVFLLNAENLTMGLSVPLYFSSARTRFNVSLIGYESGYANISVQDVSNLERFRYYAADRKFPTIQNYLTDTFRQQLISTLIVSAERLK